ncbi:site-specific recombinase XerD [Salsuginibacillus halophilus]|uniref:Site-specific recombinase XerD n=1 Tax=Salsuginibacillus halophilus TaxID=517424 RepID=A0A2P8H6C4_9BACI|nr:site-specific integrase [Salsuginibacillus halophilus]PSL41753.1 site-specific recombinase XerD [Salsuginibacillus halophilus]
MGYVRWRGKSYYYTVDIGKDPKTGKRKQKSKGGFKTKKEAERAMQDVELQIYRGDYVHTKKITFEDFAEEWMEIMQNNYRASTFSVYAGVIRNRIVPEFAKAKLGDIKQIDLQRFYNRMDEEGLSAKYIKLLHNILSAMYRDAVAWEYVTKNITNNLSTPKGNKKEMKTWTIEQSRFFLEHAKNETKRYPVFVLAIWTGMRTGEIHGLKWKDIDFERQTITVRRTVAWAGKQGHILQDVKTEGSQRTIKISDFVTDVLKQHRLKQKELMFKLQREFKEDQCVFLSYNGNRIDPRGTSRRLFEISQKIGLPRIRMHDLRHTHASISLQLNQHPKVVSERLGHKSIDITLDLYSHVTETLQEESVEQFERAMNEK